jgi:hypothetical protein
VGGGFWGVSLCFMLALVTSHLHDHHHSFVEEGKDGKEGKD